MAFYGRHGTLDGAVITLRAAFIDGADAFVDPSGPSIYIYSASVDTDTLVLEVEAETYTSALVGPLTPTRIAAGLYEYQYTIPSGSVAGTWHDVWVSTLETTSDYSILSFTVLNGADAREQRILENEFIIVELDSTIAGYSGQTLANDVQLGFATKLNPFYASVDLVRMEIGPWIDFIPDMTLALMIHWSSKEAYFTKRKNGSDADYLRFALAKFVTYDTVLRTLYLPGAGSYQPTSGGGATKWLGDLRITAGAGSQLARTASGIDQDTLGHIRKEKNEWFRVVNAGGTITYGQSFGYSTPVKGEYNSDRRMTGRLWLDPDEWYYGKPGINAKGLPMGSKKGKFGWRDRNSGGS